MKYLNKTNDPKTALQIIKKDLNPTTIAKSSKINGYVVNAKSGLSESKNYFAEFIFADIHKDIDGDEVPQVKLEKQIDGMNGDIEHTNLYQTPGFDKQPLFKVIKSSFMGDKLVGTVLFNKDHKQFPIAWKEVEKDNFGISMEYDKQWNIAGLTGSLVKLIHNKRSRLLNAFTA